MKPLKKPQRLGIVNICGLPYTVFSATAESHLPLAGNNGICHNDRQEIYIDATVHDSLFVHTLVHEVLHALWAHSGVAELNAPSRDYEEQFIKIFTSHLIEAIKSIKGMK
jgi:hypothetical protein